MMHRLYLAFAGMALMAGVPVHAETVYKCVAAGQTIYQQTPCAKAQHQEAIQLVDSAPADGKVAPMPGAPPPRDDGDMPEPSAPPAAPPPRMYGCIRATDGKPYTSRNGNPEPYLAPSGVVGDFGGSLSDTYGNSRSAVASAPELSRGKGSVGALVNNSYIWVQDQCRALSPDETCRVLRDDADANQKAIRNAFKSDKPPLEAKDASLRRQLQGCG